MIVNLSTGRTVWQGQAIESGKDLKMYIDAAAIAHLNDDMLARLGIKSGQNIKIIAPEGDVVVKAVATKENLPEDTIYIPLGPWANRVVDPTTNSTAMPCFKNIPVDIMPTDEEVLDMPTLMKVYGKV